MRKEPVFCLWCSVKDNFLFASTIEEQGEQGESFAMIFVFIQTIVGEFVESGNQRERDRGLGQLTMVCASNWD